MLPTPNGAIFNTEKTERFLLWRKWDNNKPNVLFIGLNPSTANATLDDATTKRIITHAQKQNFGGVFLMNCFTKIATNPKHLTASGNWNKNLEWLLKTEPLCNQVVFAWGKHALVKELGRDLFFQKRFPSAKCFGHNMDGSPKHPLYLPYSKKLKCYMDR